MAKNTKHMHMPHIRIVPFIVSLLIGILIYIAFRPGIWFGVFSKYVEQQIAKSEQIVRIGSMSGHMNSDLMLRDFYIASKDSSRFFKADSIIIKYNNIFHLLGKSFKSIVVYSPEIVFNDSVKVNGISNNKKADNSKLNIDSLIIINGNMSLSIKEKKIDLDMFSGMMSIEKKGENISLSGNQILLNSMNPELAVKNTDFDIVVSKELIKLIRFRTYINNQFISIDGKYQKHSPNNLKSTIRLNDLKINSFIQDSLFSKNDMLDIKISLGGNPENIEAQLAIKGVIFDKELSMDKTELVYSGKTVFLKSFHAFADWLDINANGELSKDSTFIFNVEAKNIKPNAIITDILPFTISGYSRFEGSLWDSVSISHNLIISDFFNMDSINTFGRTDIKNNIIVLNDSSGIRYLNNRVDYKGRIDSFNIDLELQADGSNFNTLIYNKETLSLADIQLNGKIKGDIRDPNFEFDIIINDLKYKDYYISSLRGFSNVQNILKQRRGDIYLNIEKGGTARIDSLSGWLIAESIDDSTLFRTLYLRNKGNGIEGSGYIKGKSELGISEFALRLNDLNIDLDSPFILNTSEFEKTTALNLHLNEGRIEAIIDTLSSNLLALKTRFSNLDIANLLSFTEQSRIELGGVAEGRLDLSLAKDTLSYFSEIKIDSGFVGAYDFSELDASFQYSDSLFSIKSLVWKDSGDSYAQVAGNIPIAIFPGKKPAITFLSYDELHLAADIHQMNMKKYHPLFLKKIPLEGRGDGVITLTGHFPEPVIDITATINDAKIGLIDYSSILGSIHYEDEKLSFSNVNAKTDSGIFRGHGYLPIDLSFDRTGKAFHIDSSMYFFMSGVDNTLNYLPPYIPIIEDIKGQFLSEIKLTGTPRKPLRNGFVKIEDAYLTVQGVENIISTINGKVVLEDNIMSIDLKGKMANEKKSFLDEIGLKRFIEKANDQFFVVGGSMDFSSFFKPIFNVDVTAKNVYYSDLKGEIQAYTDADLHISGQDVMSISGDFMLNEGLIEIEFEPTSDSEIKMDSDRLEYVIRVPITQNTFLKNNLIDAELEGEIVLIKRPGEISTLSGELEIKNGKFYYYSSIFDLEYGKIIFDPNQDNHIIDFMASTPIGDGSNRIIATLTGEMNKPFIQLRDEKQAYSTQGQLIQILTTGIIPDENNITSGALSGAAQNIVGVVLEKEIERATGQLGGFGRVDFKTNTTTLGSANLDSVSILIGKRLGRNIYMTYERSLSNENTQQNIELEYRINRNVSLIGEADEEGVSASFRLRYQY